MIGLSLLLHCFGCSELAVPVVNFANSELSMSLRNSAQIDSTALLLSRFTTGFPLFAPDAVSSNSSVPFQSFAQPERSSSALDSTSAGSSMFLRQSVRIGPTASVFGMSRLDSLSSLPVASSAMLGSPVSLHSMLHPGPSISTVDFATLDFCTSLRAIAKSGPCPLAYSYVKFNYAESMSVINYVVLGSQAFVRSFARLGFQLFALRGTLLGLPMPLQSLAWLDLAAPVCALGRLDSTILVLAYADMESLPPLRSFERPSLSLPVLAVTRLDLFSLSHSFS